MKQIYLLDTNIISEIIKPRPNPSVIEKINAYVDYCAISVISWSEAWFGVNLMPNCQKKTWLQNFLSEKIKGVYPILSMDTEAALVFAEIRADLQRKGKSKSPLDLQIAATAIANNLILVTRNTKDFDYIPNLTLENWFEK